MCLQDKRRGPLGSLGGGRLSVPGEGRAHMVEVLPPKPVSGQVDYEFLAKLHKVRHSVTLGPWASVT